jgi:hypothetical protein
MEVEKKAADSREACAGQEDIHAKKQHTAPEKLPQPEQSAGGHTVAVMGLKKERENPPWRRLCRSVR